MICQVCNRKYSYDYVVEDEDWQVITGIKNGSGKLCLDCFDNLAYIRKYKYKLISFVYPEWFKWKE